MLYQKVLRAFTLVATSLMHEANAQMPVVSSGKVVRHQNVNSAYVSARNVDVWLPDGYNGEEEYAVLYMHDGQMLFDSSITWNKQSWEVPKMLGAMIKKGKVRKTIVVGVWNGGTTRHANYFPQLPFESLPAEFRDSIIGQGKRPSGQAIFSGPVQSDGYLMFLVKELKPFIDSTYATKKGPENTFIMGSSMGGLISWYALCEYPNVFGGAGCLSTHWPGIFQLEGNPIPEAFFAYLKKKLPTPGKHKIYFDYGTATLDSLYPPLQAKVDSIMNAKGWTSKNWKTLRFDGADHSERAWAERLDKPLEFLLKPAAKRP
jgi:predicted alpha/beta superfamily hydrolase